ncbi:MAG: putative Ig domain-containing protein [Verrucomicrobia bacterium]|nr:putative Ig domain-containing protein [Verrucomicrobiota bacterium]
MNVTLLFRLRQARWLHVIQVLVFVSWMMNPFPGAFSYWTLSNGVKSEMANYPEGDDWYQQDGDGDGFNNAQEAQFGSDPYRLDSDLDGLPDSVEYQYSLDAITADTPLPYDPWSWDSNGNGFSDFDEFYKQIQAYNPVVNYASLSAGTFNSYSDADGDGLKNFEDSDPFNTDRDGDQLLNWNEAAGQMDDPYNGAGPPNSEPPPPTDPGVIIGGTWYPTGTMDSDGDGTPDHLDSFPYGSFWYQGIEYGGASSDRDSDGIPDPADPFPDGSYWYNATEYAAPLVDQDGDGIPDGLDPWPTIAGSYTYNGTQYPGVMPDQDGDGTPDAFDPTPNGEAPPINQDPWNGMPHYTYNGTEYAGSWGDADLDGIPDAQDATPNGGYWYQNTEYAGAWIDQDADGIPDAADTWPNDSWNDMPHFTYQGFEYPGSSTNDRDGDGIPDAADAYPDDRTNRADSDLDGLSDYDETTQYGTDPAKTDTDDDRLNDSDELFLYHTNPLLAKTNPVQPFSDFYMVNQADGDSDGIPNGIEQWYADQGLGMNPADPADARGDLDGDGYTNLQAYSNGWSLTAHSGTYDVDQDGILDVLEDAWNAAYPGILSNSNFNDSVEDFDGDGLMNYEEIALGLNPGSAHSRSPAVMDMQEWVWRVCAGMSVPNQPLSGITWNTATQPAWQVTTDGDNDRLPDGLLALANALNADSSIIIVPPRAASGDYDGDGMLDFWEHLYHLDPRDPGDAQANPDGDTLINSLEYAQSRNPLVSDDPPPLLQPDDPTATPHIVTTSLPDGAVNAGYNGGIVVSGGTSPYQFSLTGSLPDGLFLDENGGITGTPTTEMSSSFTVQVVDGTGLSASQALTLNIMPDAANGGGGPPPPPPLTITTTNAQMNAITYMPFSVTLAATGGTSNNYIFSANPDTLPAGLELSADNKTISGTPTATGSCSFSVTVNVTGSSSDTSCTKDFLLTVSDPLAFTTAAELPFAQGGKTYSQQIEVSGGYGQKLFSLTGGALPSGITLTPGGQLTGASYVSGQYAFTVRVIDAVGHVKDQAFTLDVSEPPKPLAITTVSLPTGGVGLGYSAGIGVSGGNGDYTFTGGGGIFSVSPNGSISGTPTEAGVYEVNVTVTDTAEGTASASFVISVAAPTLTVTGGDKQILKVGDTPAPVTVSLTAGGIGLAGVQVSMATQTTTTDEGGSAAFLPPPLMTEGPQNFPVNFPGGGDTVAMFAYIPPAGMGGTTPDVLPGPAPEIAVRPVEDDDVIFESRSVSVSSGTLQAHYSGGLAVTYVNKQFQKVEDGYHPPDYSKSKTTWTTSDGQSGEGTPPSLESVPWRPGLADGYDKKFPDTEDGPVDGPDLPGGEGGGTIWPDLGGVPFTIVYNGSYYGKSVGREANTISEVRMRRKTVEEGGSGNTDAIIKALLDETTEVDENGSEKIVVSQMENFVLSANLIVAASTIIRPNATTNKAVGQALKEADIVPDDGMKGVIGDEVPSINKDKKNSIKHFVTPKAKTVTGEGPSDQLNQPYVVLKAVGVTADQIGDEGANRKYRWEGGEPFPNDSTKRRVKRNLTDDELISNEPKEIKIVKIDNAAIIAQMDVWVIWAKGKVTQKGKGIFKPAPAIRISEISQAPGIAWTTEPAFAIDAKMWNFKFAITPSRLFSPTQERPKLEGSADPLFPPPGSMHPVYREPLSGGVSLRWDVTRSFQNQVKNPGEIPKDKFPYTPGNIFKDQPQPDSINVPWPGNDLEGNDDPNFDDEDNNPYAASDKANLSHAIGEISSNDSPTFVFPNIGGSDGDTVEITARFYEFCRAQIGTKWYRISDLLPWSHSLKVIKVNGQFINNDSDSKEGH